MPRRDVTITRRRLQDSEDLSDVLAMSPAERIELTWRISVDCWAFMGDDVAQSRLPRHVVRVIRRGR